MITSDLQEVNIDDLNDFEGDASHILAEDSQGLWKKVVFDPSRVEGTVDNLLAIKDNEIVAIAVPAALLKQINDSLKKTESIAKKTKDARKKGVSSHKKVNFRQKKRGNKDDNK